MFYKEQIFSRRFTTPASAKTPCLKVKRTRPHKVMWVFLKIWDFHEKNGGFFSLKIWKIKEKPQSLMIFHGMKYPVG
jgi:hypothetical protein